MICVGWCVRQQPLHSSRGMPCYFHVMYAVVLKEWHQRQTEPWQNTLKSALLHCCQHYGL